MRGDKNLRRAGKGAAASQAWSEFTGGGEAADPAVTAAQHVASHGGKDVAGEAVKHAWHTAPWESAKAAFGVKGATVLAAVGGAAAIGLVAVATVAVAGGGGGKGGDDVEISSSGKDGDGRDISGGGKDGDDDTSTTDDDDTTSSSSTGSSTTTSTVPGQTTTTGRSATPGGGVSTTRPTETTRPTTTRPTTTVTRPTTTQPTTTTTRPQPPTIRGFSVSRGTGPCQIRGQALVNFSWSGAGVVTSGTVVNTKTGAVVHSGITSPKGSFSHCTDVASPEWRLTLYNGNVSASAVARLG